MASSAFGVWLAVWAQQHGGSGHAWRHADLCALCRFTAAGSGLQRRQRRHLDPDQPLRHAAAADRKAVQPGLASEYQVSDDGITVTLKMRPDIKFSDGSPITVDDVKWSLDRARERENRIRNFIL